MSAPIDPRTYLVGLGLAKPGRGRFSGAAQEALTKARESGIVFLEKGQRTAEVVVSVAENGEETKETKVVDPYAHHHEPIRSGDLIFTGQNNTKFKISATNACYTCSYSFGWCKCAVPTFSWWKSGEILRLV